MTEPRTIPWKRVAVEAAAIVVSILLAFAIDAWWAEKQERDEVRETLELVLADFQESKENINFRRVRSAEKMKALEQLMEASFADSGHLSEETIDKLLAGTVWTAIGNTLSTEALDSLVASGQLRLLESEELRRDLASWPKYLDYLDERVARDAVAYKTEWLPLMMEIGYLPQLAVTMTHAPGFPEMTFAIPVESSRTIEHSALLSDNRFHNLLIELWWVQTDIQIEFDNLEKWTTSTIQMLEDELNH